MKEKTKKIFKLLPLLIKRFFREFFRRAGFRKPARNYFIVALSKDSYMIWTTGGNIVVTSAAARALAEHLENAANRRGIFV